MSHSPSTADFVMVSPFGTPKMPKAGDDADFTNSAPVQKTPGNNTVPEVCDVSTSIDDETLQTPCTAAASPASAACALETIAALRDIAPPAPRFTAGIASVGGSDGCSDSIILLPARWGDALPVDLQDIGVGLEEFLLEEMRLVTNTVTCCIPSIVRAGGAALGYAASLLESKDETYNYSLHSFVPPSSVVREGRCVSGPRSDDMPHIQGTVIGICATTASNADALVANGLVQGHYFPGDGAWLNSAAAEENSQQFECRTNSLEGNPPTPSIGANDYDFADGC